MKKEERLRILWDAVDNYKGMGFIEKDPISIPHRFRLKQDIEIAAFFSSIIAWGQRVTVINNANNLMKRMDNQPYAFVKQYDESQKSIFNGFKHRTLNQKDVHYILKRLKWIYEQSDTLEWAFFPNKDVRMNAVEYGLNRFSEIMYPNGLMHRSRKHIASPNRKSACKRLNMFLRWMVRENDGVDFGLWCNIEASQLMMPLDIHVINTSKKLGIHSKLKGNWISCEQLTQYFRRIHPDDPIVFDFALFGLGVNGDL